MLSHLPSRLRRAVGCNPATHSNTSYSTRLLRSERGAVLFWATFMVMLSIALAFMVIDGAIHMTAKTQLQNAADAGALAGATGLLVGGQDLARARAETITELNEAVQTDMAAVLIDPAVDVTFPSNRQVRVDTYRTGAHGDPLRVWFRGIFEFLGGGPSGDFADVQAYAIAELADICATQCVKPWAIPDRFNDVDANLAWTPGVDFYDPVVTGYTAANDVGAQIILKQGDPQATEVPGHFFPINYPPLGGPENPITGADQYREWIATCAPFVIGPGDRLQVEPGNMVGPTNQGMDDLIAQDPNAFWDSATNTISGSDYGISPRIVLVPFFDPTLFEASGRSEVTVVKIGAFFVEEQTGGGSNSTVIGRFMKVAAANGGVPCGQNTGLSFLTRPILVE